MLFTDRTRKLAASLPDVHLQLGQLLRRQGRHQEAERAYLRAFAVDRELAAALHELKDLGWSEAKIAELRRQGETQPPVLRSAGPGSRGNRRNLAGLLREEFGEASATRVAEYFGFIEALHRCGGAKPEERGKLLDFLIRRMRTLSAAAATPGPVQASIVIPVHNRVEYTIAAVISVLEHNSNTRYEIIIGNDASFDETERFSPAWAASCAASRIRPTSGSCGTATCQRSTPPANTSCCSTTTH